MNRQYKIPLHLSLAKRTFPPAISLDKSANALSEAENPASKVHIIPISAALVDLMGQFAAGKIEHLTCFNEAKRDGEVGFYSDGGHLSQTSGIEHLVGYGYFSILYRRSPATVEGYAPKGVPPSFDRQMRAAIWKAVVDSPFAGIDDANGDGAAD